MKPRTFGPEVIFAWSRGKPGGPERSTPKEKLPDAITHAIQLEKHVTDSGSDNPSTKMHQLVEYLRDLKK